MNMLRRDGTACLCGWLGGLDPIGEVAAGRLDAAPSRVFAFDEIRDAHRIMDAGEAGGKMVVVVE